MMETPSTLNSGMCRCCSSEGTFKDIKTTYHWMGEEEVYADMLTDCFDIKIQTPEDMDNGICEVCITQLRNAVNFKKQVLHTEKQFKRRLQGRDVKNPIKIESLEDFVDSDHLSDPDFTEEYEVPIKQEVEEKPKAKKRAAKPAAARAKKTKTEAESSEQRVARRTRIITLDATNRNAGLKLAISPNVLRLPKVGPSETRKNLHNLDVRHHTSVFKVETLDTSSDDKTLPFDIPSTHLYNRSSLPVLVEPETTKTFSKLTSKAASRAMSKKHKHNLEVVLRHSNATPIRSHSDTGYECFFCSMEFPDPVDLKTHTLDSHRDLKQVPSTRTPQLDHCTVKLDVTNLLCQCFKHFDQLTELMHHLEVEHNQTIHTDVNNHLLPFRFDNGKLNCTMCDTEFIAFRTAIEHMSKHYRNHICDICDAGFVTRASLRTHKRTHVRGEYQCDQCLQVYSTIGKLHNHTRYAHRGQDTGNKCTNSGEKLSSSLLKNEHEHLSKAHGVSPSAVKSSKINSNPPKKVVYGQFRQELAKHKHNLEIIVRNSNATPLRGHSDVGYVCFFCPMDFPEPGDLKTHTLDCHRDLKHDPLIKPLKHDHFSVKMDITNLTCQICFKDYAQLTDIMHHLRVDHDQSINTDVKDYFLPFRFNSHPLKCAVCDSEFTVFKVLLEHMNIHYRNHICDICDAGFVTRASLQAHKRTHNSGDYQCVHCHQVYNTLMNLNSHIRYAHRGQEKRNKCAYCGERFTSLQMKNNHLVKEHGVAPTVAKCTACDKTYGNYKSLRIHYKSFHMMIKNFKCSICNMEFSKSCELKRHMVKHTGARDFKCDVCQKAYGRKSTLRQHMRIHNNDRSHQCDHCKMAFFQKCSLKSHLYSKHGNVSFQ